MGLITTLKNIFNKNIECDVELDNHIVYFYKKKKYLYLNKNIIVRDGSVCVIVCKNKICDVIFPGKYKLQIDTIPETCYRMNIKSLNSNIKKIRCDLYFINTREFKCFDFYSNHPFKLKSYELGKVSGCIKGVCSVKVLDPVLILKNLLYDGKFKNDKVFNILGLYIGNRINKQIQKNKTPINSILLNQKQVEMILNTDLEGGFDKIGLFVNNIRLKAVDFNKKNQPKINEFLAKKKRFLKTNFLNCSNNDKIPVTVNGSENFASNNQVCINTYILCNHCGTRNNITNKVCNKCGKKL